MTDEDNDGLTDLPDHRLSLLEPNELGKPLTDKAKLDLVSNRSSARTASLPSGKQYKYSIHICISPHR